MNLHESVRARLSREVAVVVPTNAKLRMVLAYPNTYAVGMANLGLHSVYRQANAHPDVACERVFLPDDQALAEYDRTGIKLCGLESGTPIADVDVLAFSTSFENDYLNILRILELAGIPLRATARDERHPLVVMGGAAVSINPEPVAPFLDVCCLGEGEELLAPLLDSSLQAPSRAKLLEDLAIRPGFYVPSLYVPRYESADTRGPQRFAGLENHPPAKATITKARARLDGVDRVASTAILAPDSELGDRVLVEVARGCTKGCRYCWVGYSILPFRVHTVDDILNAVEPWRSYTDRVGLVATALLDHPEIEAIAMGLRERGFRVFSPSLIISTLSEPLLRAVVESGQRTITIAPEAGSDRMRRLIMKKISNEEILTKARMIFRAGALNLKNYVIIGLPGETEADLEAIVELGERMRDIMVEEGRSRGRIGNITMSINCLIPKPGTPLQWAPQIGRRAYRDKLRWLRRRAARVPNLIIDAMPPRSAEIQAVMSRGDRRVAELLEEWHRCGEWAPALRAWSTAHEVPLEEFLRQRNPLEPTPWGHLRVGPGLPALTNQWHKAMEVASETPESLATAS